MQASSGTRRARQRHVAEAPKTESSLRPNQPSLGTFRSGSLPNVAAQDAKNGTESDEVPRVGDPFCCSYISFVLLL